MNQKSSSGENLFWLTILILALIYILLQLLAQNNIKNSLSERRQNSIVPKKFTTVIKEFIVDDDSIKKQLENNSTLNTLHKGFSKSLQDINHTIDVSVEKLFLPVYARVDQFLDYHYSVVGEYSELGATATGEIGKSIEEKLFGSTFSTNLQSFDSKLSHRFVEELNRQHHKLDSYITQDIDSDLNGQILSKLKQDIKSNIELQQKKLLTLLGVGASYKVIVGTLSTKIATKLSSKLALKGAVKASSKIGAVGTGLVTGAICGPGAIVCSPLFALTVWFGSDALLINSDEYLHREAFKEDIISSIDEQKKSLKLQYKQVYNQEFIRHTNDMIERYKTLPLKKRERRRIKEMIDLNLSHN